MVWLSSVLFEPGVESIQPSLRAGLSINRAASNKFYVDGDAFYIKVHSKNRKVPLQIFFLTLTVRFTT